MDKVINHENQPILIIRRDYVRLMDGDQCAAALLSVFEHWTNVKLKMIRQGKIGIDQFWIWRGIPDLHEDMFELFNEHKIRGALETLRERKYLYRRRNPRHGWDRRWQYRIDFELIQADLEKLSTKLSTASLDTEACKPTNGALETSKRRDRNLQTEVAISEISSEVLEITAEIEPPIVDKSVDNSKIRFLDDFTEDELDLLFYDLGDEFVYVQIRGSPSPPFKHMTKRQFVEKYPETDIALMISESGKLQ